MSFLGRSHTTYGLSLLDHLTSGVRQRSRESSERVAQNVFGSSLKKHLSRDSFLRTEADIPLRDLPLTERDFLEIAEANVILQNRPAVIIDTGSAFYQKALAQGFRHSDLFLKSGKTMFWLIGEEHHVSDSSTPWSQNQASVPQLSLYFSIEALLKNIN